MKSIEGKATRYDQAIKVAKSKIKNDKDHVLYEDDIIEIFPELKESEDEKIRNQIIEHIKWSYDEQECAEESELFNQLTKEQQALWRKEIEQACISGGYSGLNLAKDPRYNENLEVKEVDLELIVGWFDHIAQIADDRKTLNGDIMEDWAALDEIKCLAKNSSEFIKKHYKA